MKALMSDEVRAETVCAVEVSGGRRWRSAKPASAGAVLVAFCLSLMTLLGAGSARAQAEAAWYNAWYSPDTINSGQSTQLGMNVFNTGSVALTGVSIQAAALPAGLTGSSPTTTCGGTATYNAGSRTISLSGASIPADTMCNLSLTVTSSTPGSYSFTGGTILSSAGGTNFSRPGATTSSPLLVLGAPTISSAAPSSGPASGGSTVTLTGMSFTGATAVTFGGVAAASRTVVNNTTITAVTPSLTPGAMNVAVTTPRGTATLTNGFTAIAAPTVTAVTPNSGSTTGGATVVLTGANLTGATGVTFGGTAATGFTVDSATQITATTPAHAAGAVSVAVTTGGGTATLANGFTYAAPPTVSSFTYGSIVAYNAGADQVTTLDLSIMTTGSATSYAVGSATTAQGGTVSVDAAGIASYTPPRGFRGGSDSFTWTASSAAGTSTPATTTVVIGDPTLSIYLSGAGMRGAPLSGVQIVVADGAAPYSCATTLASGALPAGVVLNSDCSLSGTPAASGSFTFTVNVTDSSTGAGPFTAASGSLALTVAVPTLTLSPAAGALPGATAGVAYSQSVSAGGGTAPYTFSVSAGALPSGLTLSGATLSGTPTTPGTFNFTLTATDASSAGSGGPYSIARAYSITVGAPTISLSPLTLPGGAVGAAYAQTVSATGGAAPYTYALTAGALPAGLTLSNGAGLSGTPTQGGAFTFTVTASDSTSGPGAPYSGSRAYALTIAAPTVTVSPATVPNATVGAAYSQAITATGGTPGYSYAVTAGALPSGLTLSPSGALSGTPSAGGLFNFTVTATDASTGSGPYMGSRAYSLTVSAPTVSVTPTTLPAATAGSAYSQSVSASGGVAPYGYAVTAGALPSGLTLSPAGVLSGTPSAGGVFAFTVTATDSATGAGPYSGSRAYSLTVNGATVSLSPASLPVGAVSAAYAAALSASGGTAPYSYAVTAGALPPGLSLASDGTLSGSPTTAGTFSFTATASDSSTGAGAPFSGARAYTITIGQGAQTIAFAPLSNASLSASPLTLSASASSGLTVGFVSDTPAVCAVSGVSLNLLQTGTCTVRAEQAGDADFAAAAPVSRGFAVTPAALTLSSASASGAVVGGVYSQANSAAGGVGPYVYAVNTGALPPGVSLNAATGDVSGTPTTAGSFVYSITVTDGQSPAVTATGAPVNVVIAKGAQSVVFTSAAPAAVVAGPSYTPTATASSGLAASFSLDASSTGCVLSGGAISFTAPGTCVINADQAGDANWNAASRVQQSFTVIANPPIVADRSSVAVTYGSSGTAIDLSGSITGGAHTSVDVTTAPAHGTVVIAGDVATYTPAAGYYGADSFAYTATGPGGTSGVATVRLTVGLPPAPTTASRSADVPYNSPGLDIDLSVAVTGVHSTLSITAAPAHGQASVAGDVVTYRPTAGYYGGDSFAYVATGPGGTSAPSTVTLTVAAPPAPVVTPPAAPVVAPPAQGGDGSVSVNLGSVSQGVVDGFRITVQSRFGRAEVVQAAQLTPASATGSTSPRAAASVELVYTPAPNFMGTDTVTVVAYGPGGDSAPASFTFQVAGKAPDLTANVASNASVRVAPTTDLVGGPFNGLRITRTPAFGTAVVDGLSIVFTPGAANGGSTSLDYVVDLPFGASAPGRLSLVSNAVPGSQTLTASTLQGVAVTTRISNTAGGPFTSAAVVSIDPSSAGSAVISGSGANWDLTFTPSGAFSGQTTVTFSLTNAFGTTNGTLAITVAGRPDPSQDAEVRGVASAQATSARRFADAQVDNFQRRLQSLHDGSNGSSNGLSLNLGLGGQSDLDNDPRTALRRQLGAQDRVEPGANADRGREMLGLDVWAGRRGDAAAPAADGDPRLSVAPQSAAAPAGSVGFWTAGSVDWGRQDAQGQRDSRFTTQGVTGGVDVRVSDGLIVGGGLGYGEDRTRIGDNGSLSEGAAVTGALYASWRPADAFYVDGVLGYADLRFDARRWTTGLAGQADGYAMSERAGDVRFASASLGRLLQRGRSVADLYARIDARQVALDAFVETGAGLGSLNWDAAKQDSLSANLGATLRWTMETRRLGVVAPTARLEWSHEFESLGAQGVRYADWAASPTYLVPLDGWSRDALRLGLGAEWSLTDRLMFSLGYRGSLGDAGSSQGGDFRLRYGW